MDIWPQCWKQEQCRNVALHISILPLAEVRGKVASDRVIASLLWNSLPLGLRIAPSLECFLWGLKTFLLRKAFEHWHWVGWCFLMECSFNCGPFKFIVLEWNPIPPLYRHYALVANVPSSESALASQVLDQHKQQRWHTLLLCQAAVPALHQLSVGGAQ